VAADGCGTSYDPIVISHALLPAEEGTCSYRPTYPGEAFKVYGTMDVTLTLSYSAVVQVENRLRTPAYQKELTDDRNNILLDRAEVWCEIELSPQEREDCIEWETPPIEEIFVTKIQSVDMEPGVMTPVFIENINIFSIYDEETIQRECAFDVGDDFYGYVNMNCHIKVFGNMKSTGREVGSNVFNFPIKLCRGCLNLIDDPRTEEYEKICPPGEYISYLGAECPAFFGQDGLFYCVPYYVEEEGEG
jgi:hypothetical protein